MPVVFPESVNIMTIVGFNFTKIHVERKTQATGKVNITNNVSIKSVEESSLSLGPNKQTGLRFSFEFVTKYEPGIGEIILNGDVLTIENEETHKLILNEWKQEEKVNKQTMTKILNHVLKKANLEALILSREINLPSPIPLPKVQDK
ncbi:MAG: hypothetical protein ACLFP2_00970 [Candidatus Woesearchaeota archaeon]